MSPICTAGNVITAPITPRPAVLLAVWKEALDRPVIDEQVIQRALAWQATGHSVRLIAALRRDDAVRCENLQTGGLPVNITRCGQALTLPLWLRRAMKEAQHSSDPPSVIVCRGTLATVGALLARVGLKHDWCVIHDARGWAAAEMREHRREGLARMIAMSLLERIAFRYSDFTTVVSEALLGVALCRGVLPHRCALISPYVTSGSNAIVPEREDTMPCPPAQVLYVGNSQMPYQGAADIQSFLANIADKLPDTSFGWLDSAYEENPAWIRSNLWRMSGSIDQVQMYLTHAQVGMLIRSSDRTNAAAMPTKAIQYLVAGCKVVTSPYPPSIAQLCEITDCGLVVDNPSPGAWAAAIRALLDTTTTQQNVHFAFRDTCTRQWTRLLSRAASHSKSI